VNPQPHSHPMTPEIPISLAPADSRTFEGYAYSALFAKAEREVPLKLYYVRFEAGARTHWHAHEGVQILVVTRGRCRYQREGEEERTAGEGESVRFEAGRVHWHGAGEEPAEHVAVNLDVRETRWLGPVSEGAPGTGG
jgi:quercetin dioxygenase-like cupin family protein